MKKASCGRYRGVTYFLQFKSKRTKQTIHCLHVFVNKNQASNPAEDFKIVPVLQHCSNKAGNQKLAVNHNMAFGAPCLLSPT